MALYTGFRLWGLGGMILAPLLTGMTLQLLTEGPAKT
jgi:predicted PurR-regulated permease PerM